MQLSYIQNFGLISLSSIICKIESLPANYDLSHLASFLADVAGVVGLVLAIYVFYINRRDRQPRLSISIVRGELMNDADDEYGGTPPLDFIFIDVANPSERRIKVTNLLIEWSANRGMARTRRQSDSYPYFQTEKKPPFFILPGDTTTYATEADELSYWLTDLKRLAGKVLVRAIVSDGTGNKYKSKWLRLDARR